MNFHLSDDQLALQDAVRRMVGDAMKSGLRRSVFESADGFDPAFWKDSMALGLGALGIYADYGGMGLDLVDIALVAEVLGHEAAPGPYLGHTLAGLAIQAHGTPEQKSRWLPRLASGEIIATVALGEDEGRWLPGAWRTDLSGGRLSGEKHNVPYPEVAGVIVAGIAGGGLAIIDSAKGGVTSAAIDAADRTRRLGDVVFADVIAESLGDGDAGQEIFDAMLVLLAADALGGALQCVEMTTEYSKTRHQFGGPIARFQGLKHRLANLISEVEPARGLVWYAAVAMDGRQDDRSQVAAIAKAHLADRFNNAARTCVELHGGIGFTWEYDLQIWVKRAMFDFAYGGTPSQLRGWAMTASEVLYRPAA